MMHYPGDRVGAILNGNDKEVYFLGYGIYDGHFPYPYEVLKGMNNPRITLDNGDIVWGCECWWGSEEKIRQSISGKKIIMVDIKDYRSQDDQSSE